MSLRQIKPANLIPILEELEDPRSTRCKTVQDIIDYGLLVARSPFGDELTIEEEVLIPPCVRLGVAVKILELSNSVEGRVIRFDSFEYEIGVGVIFDHIPFDAIRPEAIFWEQLMPSYVAFGYMCVPDYIE